ncbi:MAG TPA: CHAT domain-containing tetratricopeptide repeat protein [Roseiflexaceae bacterium]|nr:CHAT domain-containing tetratricopeptide repeat protein [Roseiflexaceae bacterium]
MQDTRPPKKSDLLSICALLRWFDRDLLGALTDESAEEIEALMLSDLVTTTDAPGGAYRLRDDIRVDALARLRAESPPDESTMHRRIFGHFLRRIEESTLGSQRLSDEQSLLYHLGELFLAIAAHQEWPTLMEYVAAIRAANPQREETKHWLSFYEAFVAIRTHDYKRGENILTALLPRIGDQHSLRIQVLNALGQAHWFQARYDHALTLYGRVLALARQIDDLFYQGIALANMGWVYEAIQQYEQALQLAIESLAIFRRLGDRYREGHVLYDIGMYALRLGRWEVAQRHLQDAIALYETTHNQAMLAYLYWGRGLLCHLFGDQAESETAYVRALEIAQTQEQGQPALAVDIHFQLGFLYQTQQRWNEALAEYERAIALARQLRNQYTENFIHYRRGNVFERQGRFDEAFAAYAQAIEGIETLRGATEAEEIKIGLLGTAQQVYESMVLLCLALERPVEAFHYVERARSRAFLDMLATKQPQADAALYDALAQPVATLAEVQSQLRADALLLEYFTLGVLPRGEGLINKLPPESAQLREHLALPPQTLIFAITRDRMEVLRPALDPNSLRPQTGDPGPGRRLLRDRLLTHLHAQLIAPAAALLRDRALLYLVPHGPLHYVPFMALRSAEGEHLLEANGPAIALAPSATVLRTCLNRPRAHVGARRASPLRALAYNDTGTAALRYAEAEACHVARLAGGEAWAGPGAKSARLIGEGGQARWLHIAGHAVYDPHDPLGSYIQLGEGDALSARTIMGELALDAELVTLSACLSGLSHVVPGDELLGLQRAFLYAGAPAVICTLWEAADFVALLVMDRFYTGLIGGSQPAAALRDAQVALRDTTGRDLLAILDRWRATYPEFVAALDELPEVPPDALDMQIYADPFYWAPFMLIGRPD